MWLEILQLVFVMQTEELQFLFVPFHQYSPQLYFTQWVGTAVHTFWHNPPQGSGFGVGGIEPLTYFTAQENPRTSVSLSTPVLYMTVPK